MGVARGGKAGDNGVEKNFALLVQSHLSVPVPSAKTLIKLLGTGLILAGAGLELAGRDERTAGFMLAAGCLLWLAVLIAQWWASNRTGR